jgi:hypothetical protein
MIDPPAGQTRYVEAHPRTDPARAARRYKPPSERAKAIMANHGMLPGSLATAGSPAALLAASLGATPAATTSQTQPAATPVATATSVVTAVPPPVTTDPAAAAATASQG